MGIFSSKQTPPNPITLTEQRYQRLLAFLPPEGEAHAFAMRAYVKWIDEAHPLEENSGYPLLGVAVPVVIVVFAATGTLVLRDAANTSTSEYLTALSICLAAFAFVFTGKKGWGGNTPVPPPLQQQEQQQQPQQNTNPPPKPSQAVNPLIIDNFGNPISH